MKCVLYVIEINRDNLGDLPGDEASREKMELERAGVYLSMGWQG